ncbi:MAG: hypothetical protein ABW166_06540 [Sedimenticola sp.]
MQNRFSERYECALKSLSEGLSKKGTTKRYDKVLELDLRIPDNAGMTVVLSLS